jgi:ubiquinone/menaquinone biosynthesis C-methylase UbiE
MPGSNSAHKQQRVWDRLAAGYDRQMRWWDRLWWPGGRAWLGRRATGRVLEVGIGTGRNLDQFGAGVRVTGVDVSPRMLAVAREHATELGLSVALSEADAEHLPYGDGRFDTVVCALALCSIPDPQRAIEEMFRVLVPGGRLLLLDHVVSTSRPLLVAQRVAELITRPIAGEHFTRRHLDEVVVAGFEVIERERSRRGTVERLCARKPVS